MPRTVIEYVFSGVHKDLINEPDENGITIIQHALNNDDNDEIVELLKQMGANLEHIPKTKPHEKKISPIFKPRKQLHQMHASPAFFKKRKGNYSNK